MELIAYWIIQLSCNVLSKRILDFPPSTLWEASRNSNIDFCYFHLSNTVFNFQKLLFPVSFSHFEALAVQSVLSGWAFYGTFARTVKIGLSEGSGTFFLFKHLKRSSSISRFTFLPLISFEWAIVGRKLAHIISLFIYFPWLCCASKRKYWPEESEERVYMWRRVRLSGASCHLLIFGRLFITSYATLWCAFLCMPFPEKK